MCTDACVTSNLGICSARLKFLQSHFQESAGGAKKDFSKLLVCSRKLTLLFVFCLRWTCHRQKKQNVWMETGVLSFCSAVHKLLLWCVSLCWCNVCKLVCVSVFVLRSYHSSLMQVKSSSSPVCLGPRGIIHSLTHAHSYMSVHKHLVTCTHSYSLGCFLAKGRTTGVQSPFTHRERKKINLSQHLSSTCLLINVWQTAESRVALWGERYRGKWRIKSSPSSPVFDRGARAQRWFLLCTFFTDTGGVLDLLSRLFV